MANIIFSEGSGLQDSVFAKSQAPIRMFIEARAEAFEKQSIVDKIFNKQPSTNALEKFTQMTAMTGFMPVGENGDYPTDGMQEGYSKILEHMVFKDSFAISREIIDDAKLMDLKSKPLGFMTGYNRTREMFGAALIGQAMQGSTEVTFRGRKFSLTTADAVALFSAAHTSVTGGCANQGNYFSNVMSADALGLIETNMQNVTDDDGNPLDLAPDTIIIPNTAASKKAALQAIGSDKDPDVLSNALNYQYGRWNLIIWPYLNKYIKTGDAPYIMMDSEHNKMYNDAVWLDRVNLEVKSEIAPNDANVWKGYARWTAGFIDWRGFAIGGCVGATALS